MVFLIIFGVGLFLTIITFIIGELFDLGDWGSDHGVDVGDSPSPFSSRVLFVFMTAFGGFGFMGQVWDWPIGGSILAALAGGTFVAGGTFFLIVLPMARQQGSVHLKMEDLVNLTGEVTDDIPEGGVGRVSIVPPGTGARVARAARSQTGAHLPAGTTVRVLNVGPSSLTVAPVDAFTGTPPPPRP
jgi:membrane protein implicated in regulation of membrane protease activity